jgi:predicted nuclease of predicted toxin-antitoxin system
MRFLADMGVSQQVVEWLRTNGHDATHLRDEGLQRLSNGEIFQKAGRALGAQSRARRGSLTPPLM